jgi:hypothetical protein
MHFFKQQIDAESAAFFGDMTLFYYEHPQNATIFDNLCNL